MYNYSEYLELTSTIRNAESSCALRSALHDYLNDAALTWWKKLEDNQREAIILLNFDASVVTTMIFFVRDYGFGGDYNHVLHLILDKAELLAKEVLTNSWDHDLRCIIACARKQMKAEEEARSKAAEIVRDLGMETGIDALEEVLVNNSGFVRASKKQKETYAKDMRRAFLADALSYLRNHYNDSNNKKGE